MVDGWLFRFLTSATIPKTEHALAGHRLTACSLGRVTPALMAIRGAGVGVIASHLP